jgi:hypothetical protein
MTEPLIVPAARIVLRPLLFAFITLAGYFVAWGLVFVMDAVVRAFFGTATGAIGWIPFAGRIITSPLLAIEHKLTSYLGGLEAHFDAQMAARWHALASLVSQIAADAKTGAILEYQFARAILKLYDKYTLGEVLRRTGGGVKVIRSQVATVTRTVVRVEKIVGAKADAVVVHRVGALAGELEHVIDWTLPRLRARQRAAEGEIGRLWHRVKANERRIGIGVAVGLVVAALGRLGLGWIRCRNVGKVGRNVCGMNPALLESLLADSLMIAGTLSLVEFAREMVGVTDTAVLPITTFWRAS